ncbi:MAG: hypothetical protein M3Y64_11350 [Gemmatimonadota bacterium]|nr:hypothetical protein [Gemmatimonadota bacterium]
MIALFLRLFALRPLFSMAIMGFPILVLIAVGLFAIMALKILVFIVLPAAIVIWLVRKAYKSAKAREQFESMPGI